MVARDQPRVDAAHAPGARRLRADARAERLRPRGRSARASARATHRARRPAPDDENSARNGASSPLGGVGEATPGEREVDVAGVQQREPVVGERGIVVVVAGVDALQAELGALAAQQMAAIRGRERIDHPHRLGHRLLSSSASSGSSARPGAPGSSARCSAGCRTRSGPGWSIELNTAAGSYASTKAHGP